MPSTREDPLVGFTFSVEIDGIQSAFFSECSGLGSEHEVVLHKAVDSKGKEVFMAQPGKMKWLPITLKRGITSDMAMWEWRKKVEQGDLKGARKTGSIVMYDQALKEVARYNFENGWPSKLSGSGLSASGAEVAIEEIVIQHEFLERTK
jgi:phage tail-like protein